MVFIIQIHKKVDGNFPAYNKKSREILSLIDQRQ